MQDNKLTVEEVLLHFAQLHGAGIFQITPQGPNDFFVHGMLPQDTAPDRFEPSNLYGNAETFVTNNFGQDIKRFGFPGQQIYARVTWRAHESNATITTLLTARKRHAIANILLEALKAGTPIMMRAAMGKGLDADKSYQPPEVLDVLHRINLARGNAGGDFSLFADLDENVAEYDNQSPIRPTTSPTE